MKKILFLLLTLCSFSGMVYSDISWSSPVAVSVTGSDATDPHVVIDSSGNATAVWVQSNAITASNLPSGGSWSTPVTLSNPLNTATTPKLGIDSSGNVTALWVENNQIESAVFSGGSWSAETSPISSSGAANPSLAVDSSGNAVAVWTRSGFVESSTRQSGTWSLVSVLSTTGADTNPHVAISDIGTAIAAWHSVISGADQLVTKKLTVATNTWGSSINVIAVAAAAKNNYPKIAIDPFGNSDIVWFRYNTLDGNGFENVVVLSASLAQGAVAWTPIPFIVSNPGIRNPADLILKLKFDVNGDAIAAWTQSFDGETFVVETAVRLFGATGWPSNVDPNIPTLYSLAYDVAISSSNTVVAYMAWDGTSTLSIQSQQTDMSNPQNQSYTLPNTFSSGSDNGYPACSLSRTGNTFNAVAVWINFNGSNKIINASTGSDSAIIPPGSVSASQSSTNLGVYTDFQNTITWTASSDPNLIQYNIYRNGVFVTSVGTGTFSFVDHNAVQSQQVIYGVGAYTSQSRQSDIINFTLF